MKEYDPMESFTNAFLDLGKRVIVFFTCFILGLIEGSIASAIANVFSKIKEVVSKQPPAQEWYEDTNTRFIDFPRLSLIVIGIIGCASACLGMVRIIQGSNKFSMRLLVILGSSMFAILFFQQLGWQINFLLWCTLGGFLILNVILLKKWQSREIQRWEAELEVIKDENKQRRKEKMS